MTEDLCPNGCVGYCRMLREYCEHWERATPQSTRYPVLTVDREKCNMCWRFVHSSEERPADPLPRPILRRPT